MFLRADHSYLRQVLRQIYGCGWAPEASKHTGEKDPFHTQLRRNRIMNVSYLLKEQRRRFNCHLLCGVSTETVAAGWTLPPKHSHSPAALPPPQRKKLRTPAQVILTSAWPSLPFHWLWWWHRKSLQIKRARKLLSPASRSGNLAITTLNFLKNQMQPRRCALN